MTHTERADLQRAAFLAGALAQWKKLYPNNYSNETASAVAIALYPYAPVTRPRTVTFVSLNTPTIKCEVTIEKGQLVVRYSGMANIYENVCDLAYSIRIDRATFAALEDLVANPTETVTP